MTGGKKNIWCVIPVYNNAGTVGDIALRCRKQMPQVLVVDDGSTDLPTDFAGKMAEADIQYLRFEANRGKGAAILSAADFLSKREADYMITIDADGQHLPEDLPQFLKLLEKEDDLLLVGCRDFNAPEIPSGSRIGRKIANFWFLVETGKKCGDCQSGFRTYPVRALRKMKLLTRHYNFETEVITRGAWGHLKIQDVPIRVIYPERGRRVSHFRPWLDNLRISLIHTHLVGLRLLPFRQPDLTEGRYAPELDFRRHPFLSMKKILLANPEPLPLATAAALGTILAVLPLPGLHSLTIAYCCARLRLNVVMGLAIQNLFNPPFTPVLCVEVGHFLRHGTFLTEVSMQTLWHEIHLRAWEWLLGSLVLAPIFALLTGVGTFLTASALRRRRVRSKHLSATRGQHGGIAFFKIFTRIFGGRHACNFVWCVAWAYAVFDRRARRAALPYLKARFPEAGAWKLTWHLYRLIVAQGQVLVLSRCGGQAVCPYDTWPEGVEYCRQHPERGMIVLCTHFGAWQTALTELPGLERPIRLLEQPDANRQLHKLMNVAAPEQPVGLIAADRSLFSLLDGLEALSHGEVLCIMGDRIGNASVLHGEFLGRDFEFPASPWWLAARSNCAILPVFCALKLPRYELDFRFFPPIEVPNRLDGRMEAADFEPYLKEYIRALESMAREYPYQLFYFETRE